MLPAPEDLPFPHVNQVWLIERYVTDLAGSPTSAIAALGALAHPLPATRSLVPGTGRFGIGYQLTEVY